MDYPWSLARTLRHVAVTPDWFGGITRDGMVTRHCNGCYQRYTDALFAREGYTDATLSEAIVRRTMLGGIIFTGSFWRCLWLRNFKDRLVELERVTGGLVDLDYYLRTSPRRLIRFGAIVAPTFGLFVFGVLWAMLHFEGMPGPFDWIIPGLLGLVASYLLFQACVISQVKVWKDAAIRLVADVGLVDRAMDMRRNNAIDADALLGAWEDRSC